MKNKKIIILAGCLIAAFLIGAVPTRVEALTAAEIESQIIALQAKITELRLALLELQAATQSTNCHVRPLWGWAHCTIACPCEIGQGDCNSNQGCKSGYCALDVGAKYNKLRTIDVCEANPAPQQTSPPPTATAPPKKEIVYPTANQVLTCDDSEEGDKTTDFYTKGRIDVEQLNGSNQILYDLCQANEPGGPVVRDYYCYSVGERRYFGSEELPCACASGICTGEVPKQTSTVETRTITDCSDSDGKDNFSTKGYVELTYDDGESKKVYDACYQVNGKEAVKDYYCRWLSGRFDYQSAIKYCSCSDGVCIEEAAKCTDTDGGENIYGAGQATSASGASIADACGFASGSKGTLREAVCQNNIPAHTVLHCPAQASYCRFGKCTAEESHVCAETDTGIDNLVKGSVTEATIKDGQTYTDFCADSNTLKEYYCPSASQTSSFQTINCPFGCADGACKPSPG